MRIVFMGTPEFAVESLKELINANNDICAVVTSPDKPAGRGLKLKESDVKQFAKTANLPILQPTNLKDNDFINQLKKYNADVFVVVAFRMLPEIVWQIPPKGTINLHASLLPNYRGAAPINWAIINGEKTTGVTTFFIEKEIDVGKIIDFKEVEIAEKDDAGILHDKLMIIGAKLLVKTIKSVQEKNIEPITQQQFIIPNQLLKTAPKLNRESNKINWNSDCNNVYNKIRGLSPYPTSWTVFENKLTNEQITIKIFSTEIVEGKHESEIGTIISDQKNYIYISTINGLISILEIQPEGRKKMNIKDFLTGFRDIENWKALS